MRVQYGTARQNNEKGLLYVLNDIFRNINKLEIIICFFLSMLVYFFKRCDVNIVLLNDVIAVFPSLTGCSIAGYAIIFMLGDRDAFKQKDKRNKYIYSVLCATFVFTIIMQLFTILLSFIARYCDLSECSISYLISAIFVLSTFSILLTCNLVLHLFTIRTFICQYKNDKLIALADKLYELLKEYVDIKK